MKRALSLCAFVLAALPLAAFADEPEPTPSATANVDTLPPPEPARPRIDYLRFGLGARVGYMTDRGFDNFASNDVLSQVSLEATYAFLTAGRVSLASGLAWDVGGRSSGLRGGESQLTVHRLTVPIEGRFHAAPWLYGFVRVAPGTAALMTSVTPAGGVSLSQTSWVFATDVSLGGSFLLGPRKNPEKRSPRVWLTPEFGYAFATGTSLNPSRGQDEPLGTDESVRLGDLKLGGIFWRASIAMTF